jgi:hypothetical protein
VECPLGHLMCRKWLIFFSRQIIPLDSNLLARTGYLSLPTGVMRSKLDMLDDIIIVALNVRIQRLLRGGLTAYNRSKCNMASPMKISTTLMKQALQ